MEFPLPGLVISDMSQIFRHISSDSWILCLDGSIHCWLQGMGIVVSLEIIRLSLRAYQRNHKFACLGGGFKDFLFSPLPAPTWGSDPIWLIFFRWVETSRQVCLSFFYVFFSFSIFEPAQKRDFNLQQMPNDIPKVVEGNQSHDPTLLRFVYSDWFFATSRCWIHVRVVGPSCPCHMWSQVGNLFVSLLSWSLYISFPHASRCLCWLGQIIMLLCFFSPNWQLYVQPFAAAHRSTTTEVRIVDKGSERVGVPTQPVGVKKNGWGWMISLFHKVPILQRGFFVHHFSLRTKMPNTTTHALF